MSSVQVTRLWRPGGWTLSKSGVVSSQSRSATTLVPRLRSPARWRACAARPFTCRKASGDPFLRELLSPFGESGYVALFEIDDGRR